MIRTVFLLKQGQFHGLDFFVLYIYTLWMWAKILNWTLREPTMFREVVRRSGAIFESCQFASWLIPSLHCQASEELLKQHYIDLKDRPFYPGLVKYMNSGPVVAMVRACGGGGEEDAQGRKGSHMTGLAQCLLVPCLDIFPMLLRIPQIPCFTNGDCWNLF